jgi:hypothetical protein
MKETTMTTRSALGAVILGSSLLLLSAPANASTFARSQSAVPVQQDFIIEVAKRGGGGGGGGAKVNRGNVNRNVNVNRGYNVNRNVNVNRNINRSTNVNRNVNVNRNINRNVYRGVNVNRGYYGGRHVYYGGSWARPRNYWWPVGGAIVAGAAIGVLTASSAAALAGPGPGAGYCWYYTDPSQTQGFWDQCP